MRTLALEFRPLVVVAGYSAYPRNPNFRILREIADEIDATFMVDMAHFAGLVAGGVLTGDLDPVPHAHVVTSTTHKSLRGPRGGLVLCTTEYAEFVDKGCPAVLGGPMPHVMAAKAVALAEARQPEFAGYARRIVENAAALADGLMRRGARLVTGGTENHLVLLDVNSSFGLTGRQAESALVESGVVTNRNSIPADPNGAWYTSGVRLGTPALTTLGLGTDELDEVAAIIVDVLSATTPASTKSGTSKARYQLSDDVADAEPPALRRPPRQVPPLPDDRSVESRASWISANFWPSIPPEDIEGHKNRRDCPMTPNARPVSNARDIAATERQSHSTARRCAPVAPRRFS